MFKTIDTTPRVIFWVHYMDWVVTGPLLITLLALLSKTDTVTTVFMVGNTIMMVLASLVGAMTVAPFKYMWWLAGVGFWIIVCYLLLQRLYNAEGYGGAHLRTLTWLTIIAWSVYPILWIVGSEGSAVLGLSQQVGLTTPRTLVLFLRVEVQVLSPVLPHSLFLSLCAETPAPASVERLAGGLDNHHGPGDEGGLLLLLAGTRRRCCRGGAHQHLQPAVCVMRTEANPIRVSRRVTLNSRSV